MPSVLDLLGTRSRTSAGPLRRVRTATSSSSSCWRSGPSRRAAPSTARVSRTSCGLTPRWTCATRSSSKASRTTRRLGMMSRAHYLIVNRNGSGQTTKRQRTNKKANTHKKKKQRSTATWLVSYRIRNGNAQKAKAHGLSLISINRWILGLVALELRSTAGSGASSRLKWPPTCSGPMERHGSTMI